MNRRGFLGTMIGMFATMTLANKLPFVAEQVKGVVPFSEGWFANLVAAETVTERGILSKFGQPLYELKGVQCTKIKDGVLHFMDFDATRSLYVQGVKLYDHTGKLYKEYPLTPVGSCENGIVLVNGDTMRLTVNLD